MENLFKDNGEFQHGCIGQCCNKAIGSSAHGCSQVFTCSTANALFAW